MTAFCGANLVTYPAGAGSRGDGTLVLHRVVRIRVLPFLHPERWGSGRIVQGSGFRVQGSGFRVQGSGFRVQGWCSSGFGCRVHKDLWDAKAGDRAVSAVGRRDTPSEFHTLRVSCTLKPYPQGILYPETCAVPLSTFV